VKLDEPLRDPIDEFGRYGSRLQPPIESLRIVEVSHVHRVLDGMRIVGVAEAETCAIGADRYDAEVHIRRQASIQSHFLVTEVAAPFQRREVQETEAHGLLDLVDVRAGDQHVGDVRLQQADEVRAMRIGFRSAQGSNQGRQAHRDGDHDLI